ncbi:MAG: response regulator [Pseudomonadota bacterium]
MRALIVQSNADLGDLWKRHLERLDVTVALAQTEDAAAELIKSDKFDVIVMDLVLSEGSGLALADLAQFRQPDANIVFVTDTTFFSDGSIFQHSANARAFVRSATPPDDLAAIVHHYGQASPDRAAHQSLVTG